MGEWLSYSLSDFLMFSEETYLRSFVLFNERWWPLQGVFVAATAYLACRVYRHGLASWPVRLLLAAFWAFPAVAFLALHHSQINLAAPFWAALFGLQALLLLCLPLRKFTGFSQGAGQGCLRHPGVLLFVYALCLHPWLSLWSGAELAGWGFFGMTPDATALGTVGLLLLSANARCTLLLCIPLLWVLFSGLMHLAMEQPAGLLTPGMMLLAIAAVFLQRCVHQRPAGADTRS